MVAVFTSDISVPMTIFYPDRRTSAEDRVVRKEVWVSSIMAYEGNLQIEQERVFRSYPDHRVSMAYESESGPYYILQGHGCPQPAATWDAFVDAWQDYTRRQTVIFEPGADPAGVEPGM